MKTTKQIMKFRLSLSFIFLIAFAVMLQGCEKEENPININNDPPSGTLSSIEVLPANPTIFIGQNRQFTATGYYSNGSSQNITSQVNWGSSTSSVASIDSTGLATGLTEGNTVITAVSGGTISGNTPITVQNTVTILWKTVSAKFLHTTALKTDNTLWTWGHNGHGQLGNGTTTGTVVPIKIGTETWRDVSTGSDHTLAIKSDGTLWAWGYNYYYQIGDGTNIEKRLPTQIGGNTSDWLMVSAGDSYSIALKTNGTLWAWGSNSYGKLGNGSSTTLQTPTQIGSFSDWTLVKAGYDHTMGIRSNGTLWAWGYNGSGRLGDGTDNTRLSPVQIGSSINWTYISPGDDHTIALKSNGSLWVWGENSSGQLGDGTTQDKYSPIQIGNAVWISISAGYEHSLGVKSDGSLWAWGKNGSGQLGNGTNTNSSVPVQEITNSNSWNFVSAGYQYSFGKKNTNTLWAWGIGQYGQLGGFTQ